MKRWIDLSAEGMRLKLAILPNVKVLVLENGDHNEAAARALGFTRRNSGAWVRVGATDINPREFTRVLPKAVIREMPEEEIILKADPVRSDASPDSVQTSDAAAATENEGRDESLEVFLGVNRLEQPVYQDHEGKRFIRDNRGRTTFEHSLRVPVPGLFLRAIDDESRRMCAEGFRAHYAAADKYGQPDVADYLQVMETDGYTSDRSAFVQDVLNASIALLTRKADTSLRDRFGTALSLDAIYGAILGSRLPTPSLSVALRRMLGNDRELLGQAVRVRGENTEIITKLLPRSVRKTDDSAADIVVDCGSQTLEEAVRELDLRSDNARTLVVLPDRTVSAADLADLSTRYHVEGIVRLSDGAGGPALVLSVGSRLPPGTSGPAPVIKNIDRHADLWTWASDIAVVRSRVAEAARSGMTVDINVDLNAADPSIGRNEFQVPYNSASKLAQPTTMIPKDLDGPSREALARAVAAYGDIDHKVAREFGFPTDELGSRLAPEQVDALALYVNAEERGRNAFLIADGAGVGKGRTLAAIAKRGVMQGRKVLFLTEKEINLGDFQRDVVHIGAQDLVKPYVMNEGASLIDEATGKEFEVGDPQVLRKAVADGHWPEGVDVIYATYSQFNRPEGVSTRTRWLKNVVDEDVLLVLDESHNAAGDSNVASNIREAVAAAGSVVYSSATFAASPKMMGFYTPLFPEHISEDEIVSMMRKGGEEFQEVISSMLVLDGVMIRREQDLSKFEFSQIVDADHLDRNRAYMDQLAEVISAMAELSGDLDSWIHDRERRNLENGIKGLQLSRMSFGSPLYTMTRLFSASLLAELAAERAVTALRNGEKPVILVENTIQAILENAFGADSGIPDFRAIVHRILDQMLSVREIGEDGTEHRLQAGEGDGGLAGAVARIRTLIDALPPLPASAIDEVRSRIEEAGFSCGEITGRTLEIRDGKIVPRQNRNRIKTKNDFNAGRVDALIINTAGSTGVDMHAGRRFKDKRRRVMIELQGPSHVLRQIQAYFRVGRRDQESNPRIELLSTGLPAEARLAAMRNQKLRRLSANVSSNRDNVFLSRNIPDLINSVGDDVISRYAEIRPDLLQRLHLAAPANEQGQNSQNGNQRDSEEISDTNRSANIFLARLMLLPTAAQEKILGELTSEYVAQVSELEARGENPLRPRELDGIVHVRETKYFEGSQSSEFDTVFDAPLKIMDVMIERVVDPIRAEDVVKAVENGTSRIGDIQGAISHLEENRDVYLEQYLPTSINNVEEALRRNEPRVTSMETEIARLVQVLKQIAPGRSVPFPYAEDKRAIITSVSVPPAGFEHRSSMYRVTLACPGQMSFVTLRLSTLMNVEGLITEEDGAFRIDVTEGLEGNDYDAILEEFESAVGRKMTPARILTSNIFRAVRLATQHKLGSLTSFVDSNGIRHRGVLIRSDAQRKLANVSLRLDGIEQAMATLTTMRNEITSSPVSSSKAVVITPLNGAEWTVKLPAPSRRKSGILWPSDEYRERYESGTVGDKGGSRLTIYGEDDLRALLIDLKGAGFGTFYASAKLRNRMASSVSAHEGERMAP